jgi:hypothetical protein
MRKILPALVLIASLAAVGRQPRFLGPPIKKPADGGPADAGPAADAGAGAAEDGQAEPPVLEPDPPKQGHPSEAPACPGTEGEKAPR